MKLTLLILVWLAGGVLAYSIALGSMQNQLPVRLRAEYARTSFTVAVMYFVGGPIGLIVALCLSRGARHGLLFWPESWRRDAAQPNAPKGAA